MDSVLLALIQIVTHITAILTTKVLSVSLSLTEYGTYATVNSVITISASLTLFGLGDSINYYYNKKTSLADDVQREKYVNTIFFVQLCVGVVVGLALVGLSGVIADYYNNALVQSLMAVICLKPWLTNAIHLYQVLFISNGKAKLIAVRNLIISVAKVIVIWVAVKVSKNLSVLFAWLVVLDVVQLIAFRYIFGKTCFRVRIFSFSKDKLIPVIKYTVPMGIYFVTTTLMREIDKLVIGRLGTTEMLAVYANCAKTLPLNLLTVSFATVLIPYIMKSVSQGDYTLTAQIMKKYLSVGYLTVWMFSGALLLCVPEAIEFLYSDMYMAGQPVFVLYILDGMVQFSSAHMVIAASGNSGFLMKTSLGLLALNVVVSASMYLILDVYGMGMLGPALATVLISTLYVCILHWKNAQILQRKIRDFIPVSGMVRYVCQLAAVGAVLYWAKKALQTLEIHWCVTFIVICVLYCGIVGLLHLKEYKELFLDLNRLRRTDA